MLIDTYLPEFSFNELHKSVIPSSCEKCYIATLNLDLSHSFISKTLIKLRGLPSTDLTFKGFLKNMCFTLVEENPFKEIVIDASRPGLQMVWNFYFKELRENKTLVSTETRIRCLTKKSRFWFPVYWFFIKPFSGLIRKEILKLIRKSVKPASDGSQPSDA